MRGVIETKACKFLGVWKATRRPGGGFNVSAKVEVRDAPDPTLSQAIKKPTPRRRPCRSITLELNHPAFC